MKTKLLLSLILGVSLTASAELVEQWNFGDDGNFSSVTTYDYTADGVSNPTGRHIGGPTTTASAYVGWDERAAQGATLGVNAVAAGSTRFGSTQAGILNGYYGPSTFAGVPWVGPSDQPPENYLNDGYYVAAASAGETVDITLKITDLDWSATTGNSGNNANFSFRLWDKATGILGEQAGGPANTYFMGLTIMDSYNSDRLQLAVTSSNGTILSGGTGLTGQNNRTRVDWLGANNELTNSNDYEFGLSMDLAAGTWAASINGVEEADGTFDTSHINGFDRYQATFQQFSNGDYIDIDEISVNVIPEPASVSMIALAGGSVIWLRRRFAR
jgi:hypothetical protein